MLDLYMEVIALSSAYQHRDFNKVQQNKRRMKCEDWYFTTLCNIDLSILEKNLDYNLVKSLSILPQAKGVLLNMKCVSRAFFFLVIISAFVCVSMCALLLNMLNCSWNGKFYLKMKGVKKVHENIFIAFIMFSNYVI